MILIKIRSQLWRGGVPKVYTRKIPNFGVQIFNSHWANFCTEKYNESGPLHAILPVWKGALEWLLTQVSLR